MGSNNEQGIKDRIKARLLEATSEDDLKRIRQELKEQGEKAGSIDACVSELRKQGLLKFSQLALSEIGKGSLDELVRGLIVPEVVDGRREAFNAGVEWATRSILTGIRLSQELSSLGIAQAGPLIQMAKQMHPDAGEIAKEAGVAMGGEIAGKLFDYFETKLPQKADIATVPKPFEGILARTLETALTQFTDRLMGIPPGQGSNLPQGWTDKRK